MATEVKKKKANIFVRIFRGIPNFFKGLAAELKKVTWPSKKELFKSTVSVLAVCFIIGVLIFGIDAVLEELSKLVRRTG